RKAHKSGTNFEVACFSPVVYRVTGQVQVKALLGAPQDEGGARVHHQAWKWCVGPWPEPILMRFAAASAAVTKLLAARTASVRGSPLARPAAIADDSVQPVPWVFWVAMRSAARRTNAVGSIRRSTLSAPLP